MDIELLKRKFTIEMISATNLADQCCICNKSFLSDTYEKLALWSVDDNHYAVLLKHKGKVVAECVFTIDSSTDATIQLLCSKTNNDVGAATMLMCSLLEKLKNYGLHTVGLTVARHDINDHAVKFYEKFGFHKTAYLGVYKLDLSAYPGECKFLYNMRRSQKRGRLSTSSSNSTKRNNKRQEVIVKSPSSPEKSSKRQSESSKHSVISIRSSSKESTGAIRH